MKLFRKARAVLSLLPFWLQASSSRALKTPLQLSEFAFGCPGIVPMQVPSELNTFASMIKERPPKAFLEIGTRNGGTFFVLCRLADPAAVVISLDLPGGRFGGGYTIFQIPVIRHMKQKAQQLHLLRADSHSADTRKRIAHLLG